MTMNQMALSAASVAVMANNNTLVNMGAMQESFFELDGSTIKAGLEATNVQAAAEEKSIIDQADAQRINAGCSIGGAITGMAATGFGMYSSSSDMAQARALETTPSQVQASVSAVSPNTPAPPQPAALEAQPDVNSPAATITAQSIANPPVASPAAATIEGQLNAAPAPQETDQAVAQQRQQQDNAAQANATDQTGKTAAVSEDAKKAAADLIASAKSKSETFSAFGNLLNTAIGNSGGFASYNTTVDQANQAKIKDLESGVAQVLGSTLAGLIGSQIGYTDQTRNSTYQLMGTLQQHQG